MAEAEEKERKHLHCFLAKRYVRKPKAGAGKELHFQECSEEIQQGLLETRKKEWNNWKQFKAVKIIPPEEVESFSYSACTGRALGSGDISAAFLQGTGISRVLAFRLPPGGVPDPEVQEGSLMLAEKAVYGTRDAPRGFWKGLHETLLKCGLMAVPLEQSAYTIYLDPKEKCVGFLELMSTTFCGAERKLWIGSTSLAASVMQNSSFVEE